MERVIRLPSESQILSARVALDANGIPYSAIRGAYKVNEGLMVDEADYERAVKLIDSLQVGGDMTPTPRFVQVALVVILLAFALVPIATCFVTRA